MGKRRLVVLVLALSCASACSGGDRGAGDAAVAAGHGCLAQAVATYDFVRLVRKNDGSVWRAAQEPSFQRVGDAELRAIDIAASGSSAYSNAIGCALVEDGSVRCFTLAGPLGSPSDLGAGSNGDATSELPQQVVVGAGAGATPLEHVVQLSGGQNGGGGSFCALTEQHDVYCWGYSANGLLGVRGQEHTDHAEPVRDETGAALTQVAEVRVGYGSSCARLVDGSVWCWGDNAYGELGFLPSEGESPTFTATPRRVPLEQRATRLAASPGTTHCAILADSSVSCWGRNHWGQAGAPDRQQRVPPTRVLLQEAGALLSGVLDLAPDRGMEAMCANRGPDGLWCWGNAFAADRDRTPTGPYAARVDSDVGAITAPLSSYGATNGSLVYVDAQGRLVLGGGALPAPVQPSCD